MGQVGGVSGYLLDMRPGGGSLSLTVDTQANILATSPAGTSLAFATDTLTFMLWDGSNWYGVVLTSLSFGQLDFSDADNSAWIGVI